MSKDDKGNLAELTLEELVDYVDTHVWDAALGESRRVLGPEP